MRLILLFSLTLLCSTGISQKSLSGDLLQPLHYYLLKDPTILKGKVVSNNKKFSKIEVSQWIKNEYKYGRTIKIRDYSYQGRHSDSTFAERFGLEVGQEYIFILRTSFAAGWKSPLDHPEFRFLIKNDSIFIPASLLYKLDDLNLDIHENSFHDPLFKEGHKISVDYFIQITLELNETFTYKRSSTKSRSRFTRKRRMKPKCLVKHHEIDSTAEGLMQGLLESANSLWTKKKCVENYP